MAETTTDIRIRGGSLTSEFLTGERGKFVRKRGLVSQRRPSFIHRRVAGGEFWVHVQRGDGHGWLLNPEYYYLRIDD